MSLRALILVGTLVAAPAARAADVVVADLDAVPGSGAVYRVAPDGTSTVLARGGRLVDPEGVAISPTCEVYISDATRGAIEHTDIRGGPLRPVSSGPPMVHPVGLTVTPSGSILTADEEAAGGGGALLEVDPHSGRQRIVASGGDFRTPLGVALHGRTTYVADADAFDGAGAVFSITAGGRQRLISRDPAASNHPQGIAVDGRGRVLLTDMTRGELLRVDADGVQTAIMGAPLIQPRQLAVQRDGSVLLVDAARRALFRVVPGRRTITRLPVDRPLKIPFGLALVPPCVPVARLARPRAARRTETPVRLSAAASFDRDSPQLRFAWDLDGDGRFETRSGSHPSVVTRTPRSAGGIRLVRVRVSDRGGRAAEASTTVRTAAGR